MNGCKNCRYCKCYCGDYWTPDEYECQGENFGDISDEEFDAIFTRVWENGEEWSSTEEPICPAWKEYDSEEEYWAEYAYKENHYDKYKED